MALVAASGNGSAPSTAANRKNNGATLLHAGNADLTNGPTTKTVTLIEVADDFGASIGSVIAAKSGTGAATTDRVGISGAISNTPGFSQTATTWVMRGGNVTTSLAGSANTVLVSAGRDYNGALVDGIHQNLKTQMVGSGNGTFDLYARPSTQITPNYTKGGDAGSSRDFVAPSGAGDVTAVDNAAAPSRSVPGELTYHTGAVANPTTDEYKASNVYES